MKVSIAIPVLNDMRVGRALDSVLSQQHEHELELIVVDAGSTDSTLEVLERYRERIAMLGERTRSGHIRRNEQGHRTGDRRCGGHPERRRPLQRPACAQGRDGHLQPGRRRRVLWGPRVYERGRRGGPLLEGPGTGRRWRLGWMPPIRRSL